VAEMPIPTWQIVRGFIDSMRNAIQAEVGSHGYFVAVAEAGIYFNILTKEEWQVELARDEKARIAYQYFITPPSQWQRLTHSLGKKGG
jgi:hypothetical protein